MVKFVNTCTSALGAIASIHNNPDGSAGGVITSTYSSSSSSTSSSGSSSSSNTAATAALTSEEEGVCPITTSFLDEQWRKYHGDNTCDKAAYNQFRDRLNRAHKYRLLKVTGNHVRLPNAKTVTCPAMVTDLRELSLSSSSSSSSSSVQSQMIGLDTSWFVENTASTPVVLSLVNEHGVEVSPFDSKVVPPQADPRSILPPGKDRGGGEGEGSDKSSSSWAVIPTYEGHVYHVRELLPDGSTGKVLLQHRVGLIPIGQNTNNHRALVCPDVDNEPLVTLEDGTQERDPQYQDPQDPNRDYIVEEVPIPTMNQDTPPEQQQRTFTKKQRIHQNEERDCNTLELGFRNLAACPLHAYYVEENTCHEEFKFHLGIPNPNQIGGMQVVEDFMLDWKSPTRWMTTYMGNTFVFRSAFSDQVVETITVQPTQIVDCPDLKNQAMVVLAASDRIAATTSQAVFSPYGSSTSEQMILNHNNNNSNNTTTTTATTTATSGTITWNGIGGTSGSSHFYASTGGSFF